VQAFGKFMREKRFTEALGEAETAANLDPASATAWKAVGDALEALNRSAEARAAYQNALHAQELDPVFQKGLIEELQKKLSQ
jgi:Flp pilus assembly protein TadD